MIKVVHYLNQFFAGVGAEEKADVSLEVISGPIGPGIALEKELAGKGKIVATIYAGDNYANEKSDEFLDTAIRKLEQIMPDVIVAGPAFNAGRYGTACAMFLRAAGDKLGIPGVVGLSPDNPGAEMYRKFLYIVPTGRSAAGMRNCLPPLARLALRLGQRVELGSAYEEGYLPRGIRKNVLAGNGASIRAVDMALARLKGKGFRTELEIIPFEKIDPPKPIEDLSKATVALVTEGGIVPAGNPDKLETWNANRWFHYKLPGNDFKKGEFEAWHGGHITDWVNEDPDRNVPLDAIRSFEQEGMIGKLYDEYCVTTGNASTLSSMSRIGGEIAKYLKGKLVDAVVLTAT